MPPNSGYCDCCLERIQPRRGKYADLPFCSRCMSGECRDLCRVLKHVDKYLRNLELREQANKRVARRLMPCGWRCGARLTEHQMRRHLSRCPKRPARIAKLAAPSGPSYRTSPRNGDPKRTDRDLEGEAWTPARAAHALRVGLRCRSHGERDAGAFLRLPQPAEALNHHLAQLPAPTAGMRTLYQKHAQAKAGRGAARSGSRTSGDQ